MSNRVKALLGGVSICALFSTALSAETGVSAANQDTVYEEAARTDTIVVTARRRQETVQDVPAVVNPVTREQLERFNLRDVTDIAQVVPGLSLGNNANGVGGSASIRGVNFDVNASGNNPTIEFYWNDAPITAGAVLNSAFDVGQIEVVRGPQGTLKGRASPSGAINFATRKPDLLQYGGYVNATATDSGGYNLNGALNIPVKEDVFGIRIAAVSEENEINQVRTVNGGVIDVDPKSETRAGRISVLFTPTDWFEFNASYQHLEKDDVFYNQYESLTETDPSAMASPIDIAAGDRRGIQESPRDNENVFDIWNASASVDFRGQSLIYVGQWYSQELSSYEPDDRGNFFNNFEFGQDTFADTEAVSHEIRLQNEERIFGQFDYVVGALYNFNDTPTDLTIETPVASPIDFATFMPISPADNVVQVAETPISRRGDSTEISYFGNITWHATPRATLSAGVRYIDYEDENSLDIGGNRVSAQTQDETATIYSASARYEFLDNLTGYLSYGTSWRPGISVVGDFSLNQSALEQSFQTLEPEESESFELGIKSKWFDNRLSLNLAAYHQEFENYPYRSPGGVFFVNYAFGGFDPMTGAPIINPEVDNFNFVAAVPVEVQGVEADIFFRPNNAITVGSTLSYSDGEIQNGTIPCNDLDGDGVPDQTGTAPSLGQLLAAVGTDNLSACNVSQESAFAAPFQASIFAEYHRPLNDRFDGYIRSLFTYDGDSENDPTNSVDNVDAYGTFDVFTGLRDPDGAWELSVFAKNILDEEVVLTRGAAPAFTAYQQLQPPTFMTTSSETFASSYREITTNRPREFGVSFRYYFGSR